MSNVVGITVEGGVTFGLTDYRISRVDYAVRGDLEYYLPSTGSGNLGFRFFGQTGYVSGRGNPPGANNPTDEFTTRTDILGGALVYILSIDDVVYPWFSAGASNVWFYPQDGNGNKLPNYATENYSTFMLALNGDAGIRVMLSKHISFDASAGIVFGKKDFLDDIKTGSNSDMFFVGAVGASYYIGRPENLRRGLPHGIQRVAQVFIHDTTVVIQHDTVAIIKHDTVVIAKPAEVTSVVLSGDANFEFNKSNLLPNAYAVLDSLVSTMGAHPDYRWEIDGYTDGIGSADYNIKLSQRRAKSVVDYLVSKGVKKHSLKVVGHGKENPIATNDTPEGRSMNRRVEIKVLPNK
jgi:outer membrane protein OmpA-like peptidoglycan-associated protein